MSDHHSDHSKPRSVWPIFLVGLLLLVAFYLITVILLRSRPAPDPDAERAELRVKNLAELKAASAQKLDEYSWSDKATGAVRIPITEAMRLVIPALNQNKPHAAYPVGGTPAADPTTEASPAPTAQPQASPAAQPSPAS